MAETGPNEIKEIGISAKSASVPLQFSSGPVMRGLSKPDGYDGMVDADPLMGKINLLRQMALQQGKLL